MTFPVEGAITEMGTSVYRKESQSVNDAHSGSGPGDQFERSAVELGVGEVDAASRLVAGVCRAAAI